MSQHSGTEPILIVGGFGSNYPQYTGLRAYLQEVSGRHVAIAPLTPLEWAGAVIGDSYSALLRVLDRSVRAILNEQKAHRIILVAHSAGGVLSRIYMGNQPYGPRKLLYQGFERIAALATLGTPHTTNRTGRQGGLNQIAFVQALLQRRQQWRRKAIGCFIDLRIDQPHLG